MSEDKKEIKKEKDEVVKNNKKEKEDKKEKEFFEEKTLSSKIINVVLWVIVFVWMGICLVDYFRTRQNEKPFFTFAKHEEKYSDGIVTRYTGLGYRIHIYERESYMGADYGPFWSKDKSPSE